MDPESEKIKRQFRERQRLYKQQEREDDAMLAATGFVKKRKVQPINPVPHTRTQNAKEESKTQPSKQPQQKKPPSAQGLQRKPSATKRRIIINDDAKRQHQR